MNFDGISACLVTRGDVPMGVLLGSLPFDDVVVYDNSEREDLGCFGRFAAIAEAKNDWIYTQDDDLLAPIPALVRAANTEYVITANRPAGEPWRFLGCGAIFHRSLVRPLLDRYTAVYGEDKDFYRVADVVFSYQQRYRSVDLGYLDFPWQTAPNRMYHQADHIPVRERAVARVTEQGWLCPEVSAESP